MSFLPCALWNIATSEQVQLTIRLVHMCVQLCEEARWHLIKNDQLFPTVQLLSIFRGTHVLEEARNIYVD